MGLVKFGATTVNIAEVPDGHIIISEADHTNLKRSGDAYLLLKSKIPIGVNESDLPGLVERGQRYDTLNSEFGQSKTKVQELTTQLTAFKDMPSGFSKERWNELTTAEAKRVRDAKIQDLQQ